MLIFGIDVPLIEIMFVMGVILFILLIEVIFILSLLVKHLNKTKKLGEEMQNLSNSLLGGNNPGKLRK